MGNSSQAPKGSAAGRLVITIMGAVSQWERESTAERTRDVLAHKRSNGERVGNIHYGFRLAGDGTHVEPEPGEQAVLAAIRGPTWPPQEPEGGSNGPQRPGLAYAPVEASVPGYFSAEESVDDSAVWRHVVKKFQAEVFDF